MNHSISQKGDTILPDGSPDADFWNSHVQDIITRLKTSPASLVLREGQPTAIAYLLARALQSMRKSLLLIAATDREAEKVAETIAFFAAKDGIRAAGPLERRVWYFPSRTGHKAQSLGKKETTARRLEALYALQTAPAPVCVVASAQALLERLPRPEFLRDHADYLVAGERVDPEQLCRNLIDRGYYRVSLVEEYGDFSRRGGIVDIYAPMYRWPVRLEFFDDELESIRLFHPSSQRSMGNMEDVILLPSSEIILDEQARQRARKVLYEDVQAERLTPAAANVWLEKLAEEQQLEAFETVLPVFYETMTGLWDYLDAQTVLVWSADAEIRKQLHEDYWRLSRDRDENPSPHEWRRPVEELFADPQELGRNAERFQQLWIDPLAVPAAADESLELGVTGHDELVLAVKSHINKERLLEPLAEQFRRWLQQGIHCFLICRQQEQAKRLVELLSGYGVDAIFTALPFGAESYDAPAVKVQVGSLDKGFLWPAERLAVVCEEEIFGRRGRRRSRKSVAGIFLNSFQDLHVGDFVVHVDHGIGIYKELMHLNVRDIESDFLRLEYQDGDRLYVPVDKLQKVQKYLGVEGEEPRLDKLGGKSWEAAKKKARESAEKIAEELLNLYATRQVREGIRFSPPDQYFREMEASFAYEETSDQLNAIEDVLEDMASPRPMDRLICGDVGFGKTEVALRAAFKAVMDGKQVAILVPTTVLAEQHYQTFKERFEGFPVEVATLSRFKSRAQQKPVLEGIRKGTVDVLIGTHRILQKDLEFRELGLLIIDEEHRFGVKHKERLKQLRASVDVLALTATPIPRTLQMSLAGLRDLSTIETAPQDRHAIETSVCSYDEYTIREAIYREVQRGGQVFFVHNHVQSIYQMANTLSRLVPEARIAVAHGQMKERELETVMLDFVHQKVDVLVCTTIIESGLDIPAANTIIINRADKFGLAQIYQLRGRVGRSSEQAYAYLLIPGEHLLSRDAQKRLRALLDFGELGAGFKIAMNDLQIRGGGTILGASQSGHIAAVGYELYLELLEKTINSMKGDAAPSTETIDPEINVPLSALLPETFIPNTDQRLLAYKRLATVPEESDIDDLAKEWRDRFGPFPDPVRSLILLAKLRIVLRKNGITGLDGGRESFTLHFNGQGNLPALISLLQEKKCSFQLPTDRKLTVEIWGRHLTQRLERLKSILQQMPERVSDVKSIQ